MTDLCEIFLEIRPEDIAFLKFILESYESVGIVRTIDQKKSIVVLLVANDFKTTAQFILDSLRKEVQLTEVPRPQNVEDDWLFKELVTEETFT